MGVVPSCKCTKESDTGEVCLNRDEAQDKSAVEEAKVPVESSISAKASKKFDLSVTSYINNRP